MSWKLTVNYTYEIGKKDSSGNITYDSKKNGTCSEIFSGQYKDHESEANKTNALKIVYEKEVPRLSSEYEYFNLNTENITFSGEDISFDDSSSGKAIQDITQTGESTSDIKTSNDASVALPSEVSNNQSDDSVDLLNEITNAFQSHIAWDPRLYRVDEYFLSTDGKDGDHKHLMRIPFASNTAVTAFADLTNRVEAAVVKAYIDHGDIKKDSKIGKLFANIKLDQPTKEDTNNDNGGNSNQLINPNRTEKIITHDTKDYENDNFNWGVQSIVNPFSVTKLVGGLTVTGDKNLINYMYDIRDHRRFYAMQEGNDNLTSVSNPTVTQLIKWSNCDMWGRTPYSFQDFVYCKYFGLISNNRLITLRRYTAPTYDNLQFENMNGSQEQKTKNNKNTNETESTNVLSNDNPNNKTFAPLAQVVTWFGGDTGNSLNNLMSFTTGINWGEVESQIWDVSGETGESKQAVIDKLLGDGDHSGLFGKSEKFQGFFSGPLSQLTGRIASLGKFNLALNGRVGISQDAYDNIAGANVDPFESTFRNRIQGPVNRVDKVKKRDPGIKFSQSLTIKCSYKAKAIGGINPKAALLDVLGNCLAIVSPHAVFWGGGHRFMVKPKVYPFHDGGWRDSFLAKIYDGKILGDNGAIATVLSGFKKVGEDGQGHFDFDTAKQLLGKMGGTALGLLGQAISSLSDIFGGVDFLTDAANAVYKLGDKADGTRNEDQIRKDAKQKAGNLLTNLKQMWHNKMMAATAMPHITAGGNILIGEPVGEWHLTIGNPLNPIMVIGNLICNEMKVTWDEELGPDDFPEGFSVEYSLDHAMARDNDAIQSMFNRGMGKFYSLPDYIMTASDQTTWVDKFTKNAGAGTVGKLSYKSSGSLLGQYGSGYQTYKIDPGKLLKTHGNFNTTLITKYTPINTQAMRSVADRQSGQAQRNDNVIARIRAHAATRKLINN